DLTVNGGTTPYGYLWSNGTITEDLSGIVAGSYTVTITDANGCTLTHTAAVSQPNELIATLTPTAVACFGESTGQVTTSVAGGTGTYSYLWSTSAITPNITGLVAGSYTVTVTDVNSCEDIETAIVTEPLAALTLDTNLTHVLCFGAA